MQNWKKILVASAALLGAHAAVAAEEVIKLNEGVANTARELCAGGKSEGSYVSGFGAGGRARVNIVCFGPEKIGLNIRSLDADYLNFTLLHVAIDGDYISFLSYAPDSEVSHGMPAHGLARVRLSLTALRAGSIKGDYRGLRTVKAIALNAAREEEFPNLLVAEGPALKSPIEGEFEVNTPDLSFQFSVETIGGILRGNLVFPGGTGHFLSNGMPAKEAHSAFYLSSGVLDDEAGRANLLHLRGKAKSANELEVYYLDTKKGLLGPFTAKRI